MLSDPGSYPRFSSLERNKQPPKVLSAVAVLIAGASAGFSAWSCTVSKQTFNSYLFHNNLASAERSRLIMLLVGGALACFCAWVLLALLQSRGRNRIIAVMNRSGVFFAPGVLLGFWPLLSIQAFEVFYTFQFFALFILFLAAAFLILYGYGRKRGTLDARRAQILRRSMQLFTGTAAVRFSVCLLILFTVAYAVFFVMWTLGRHRSFHSYAFDLGWQHQAFYTLLHTGNPRITLYATVNHLGNHFQPLYYLLAPIYALYQDATTLLVLQTILLAVAAIPLYLIARRRLGSPWAALVVALVYLLFPALHGINNFDFHGLALLIPFVCFMLYALETDRFGLFWLLFVLALITREDTAISLSGVGLYLILDRHRRKMGLIVLGVCIAYFLFVLKMMTLFDGYADLQNYSALVVPEHQNFVGVLLTLFTNPYFVLRHVFIDPRKIEYLLQILIPALFLPLFAGKRVVLILPGVAIMLLSNTFFNYWICCPYSAHIIPYVFFLTIIGVQRIRAKRSDITTTNLIVPLLLAGVLMNYEFGLIFSKRFPGFLQPTEREQTVYEFFEQIPKEASLTVTRRLAPHLAARRQIHLLQAPHPDTDYILIDLDVPKPAIDTHEHWYQGWEPDHLHAPSYVVSRLRSGTYGVVRYQDRFILLGKGTDTRDNADVARSIRSMSYTEKPTIIPYFTDPATTVNPPRHSEADLLRAFIEDNSMDTIVLAGKGDTATNLSYFCKKHMVTRGSNIHTLNRGGSYLAVFRNDKLVLELIDNDQPVAIRSSDSVVLRSLFPDLELELYSSGGSKSSQVSIRISGKEYASNRPGMNAVVLDDGGQVKTQAVFSTGR